LSGSAAAASLIPTAEGTAWRYSMTEELGKSVRVRNAQTDAAGKIQSEVVYRIDGTEDVDGKQLLKCEMHRAGAVTNTDLLSVDEHGILCWARINVDGEFIKLAPAQIMIANPLKRGGTWDFDGHAGDVKIRQHYVVDGEDDVRVPAGKFRAFHIHADQTSPNSVSIDRWFVPGVGIIRDVSTTRAANGDLLQRISLELLEPPKTVDRPEVKAVAAPKKISVTLANDRFGRPTSTFSSNTPRIYARWRGHRLRQNAKLRAVWIADNLGPDFPPDYKIDEASAIVETPTANGVFTLSRPEDGWVPGDYRLEVYVDDVFVDAVKLKILK